MLKLHFLMAPQGRLEAIYQVVTKGKYQKLVSTLMQVLTSCFYVCHQWGAVLIQAQQS